MQLTSPPHLLQGAAIHGDHSWLIDWMRVCFLIGVFSIAPVGARPLQESQVPQVVLPARVGLLAVSVPELSSLEQGVREQLAVAVKYLTSLVSDASARDSELAEGYGLLGQLCHAYSLNKPAEECYLNAVRLAPRALPWLYLMGRLYQSTGRQAEAVMYLREARRVRPDYLAAAITLGDLYLEQGRIDEARKEFSAALEIDRNSAPARYGLGQAAMSSRDFAEAAGHFEKVLELVPQANRVHYSLAMAYRGLGQMERAAAELKLSGSVGVRPPDPLVDGLRDLVQGERIPIVRGRMAFAAGRFAEAAEEFQKAVDANPRSIAARVNLAAARAQMGQVQEAIEQYRKVLADSPQSAAAHFNLGVLLANVNQHAEAATHFEKALEIQPGDADVELLLARELATLGRVDEALRQIDHVLGNDPDNEDALLAWVDGVVARKEYQKAILRLREASERLPDRGRTAHALAYLLAACPQQELRDGERAVSLARRVYSATGRPEHGATLVLALAESGRCGEAVELQSKLITQAQEAKNLDLAGRLKALIDPVKKSPPCRPIVPARSRPGSLP